MRKQGLFVPGLLLFNVASLTADGVYLAIQNPHDVRSKGRNVKIEHCSSPQVEHRLTLDITAEWDSLKAASGRPDARYSRWLA